MSLTSVRVPNTSHPEEFVTPMKRQGLLGSKLGAALDRREALAAEPPHYLERAKRFVAENSDRWPYCQFLTIFNTTCFDMFFREADTLVLVVDDPTELRQRVTERTFKRAKEHRYEIVPMDRQALEDFPHRAFWPLTKEFLRRGLIRERAQSA